MEREHFYEEYSNGAHEVGIKVTRIQTRKFRNTMSLVPVTYRGAVLSEKFGESLALLRKGTSPYLPTEMGKCIIYLTTDREIYRINPNDSIVRADIHTGEVLLTGNFLHGDSFVQPNTESVLQTTSWSFFTSALGMTSGYSEVKIIKQQLGIVRDVLVQSYNTVSDVGSSYILPERVTSSFFDPQKFN